MNIKPLSHFYFDIISSRWYHFMLGFFVLLNIIINNSYFCLSPLILTTFIFNRWACAKLVCYLFIM